MRQNKIRKVKEYRLLKDYTQEYVAHKIGMTTNTYSLKENNKRKFTLEEALKLSDFYGVTVNDIFTLEDIQ